MNIKNTISCLLQAKTRTVLTICSVAVGVFAVTVISAVGNTATSVIGDNLDNMGINSVLVEAGADNVKLTDSDITAVSLVGGIKKAMPLMMTVTSCDILNSNIKCMAWGVNNNAGEIISLKAKHGRLINSGDISAASNICVIDSALALQSYGRENIVGKKIGLSIAGKYREYEIVGVASSGLNSLQSMASDILPYFVYLPYTTVQNICNTKYYDKIAISLADGNGSEVLQSITDCFDRLKGENSVKVNNLLAQKQQLDDILSAAQSGLSAVAGISLGVSAFSVAGSMLISVNERRREIGIKKALGAKNSRIVAEFLTESVMISVIGSIAGAIAATAATAAVCVIMNLPYVIPTESILITTAVCGIIGMISGIGPAYKAAKLKPVEALKAV